MRDLKTRCAGTAAFMRVALISAVLACTACGGPAAPRTGTHPGWPAELRLALGIDAESIQAVQLQNGPFIERIQRATGLPITFFNANNYSAVVEAMRAKRVDGIQVGVFAFLLSEREAGAEAIAVPITTSADPAVYDPSIYPGYNGVIVVKKGGGIRTLADLKGRSLNFGDPAGTSDHLVPKSELIKAGIIPDKDVRTRFAGSNTAALMSLWHGSADASAGADLQLRNMVDNGQAEACLFPDGKMGMPISRADVMAVYDACPDGKLVAIHAAHIPASPFALRTDLPEDLKAAIREALLSTTDDPAFVKAARRWYVDPKTAFGLPSIFAYYDAMRERGALLNLDLRRLK